MLFFSGSAVKVHNSQAYRNTDMTRERISFTFEPRNICYLSIWGWSGGAIVLGKLPVPGRPTILIKVGQGPIALAVGAGGGGLDIFTPIYPFSPLSPSLWETARYRLKYCLKGPLNPKQPTISPYLLQLCQNCSGLLGA